MQQIKHHHKSTFCVCKGGVFPSPSQCVPGCTGQAHWCRGPLEHRSPQGYGQRRGSLPTCQRCKPLTAAFTPPKRKVPSLGSVGQRCVCPRAWGTRLSPGWAVTRSPALPLPLPLSLHKLATNTFQVVLISCLEDFKGPFGRAYAAAGSWLCQTASPPPPGSRPTATPGAPTAHWCPLWGTCPTQRVHPLLLTAPAGQEGRFRVPKVGYTRCDHASGILLHRGGSGSPQPACPSPISAPACVWHGRSSVAVP